MTAGRPKGAKLDPENPNPVIVEVCEFDERGRVRFPPRITSGIEWFQKGAFNCLMVLDIPGRVVLLPWKPFGEQVIEKRRELIEEFSADSTLRDALISLEYRYHRLPIPVDSRPYVGSLALFHLDLPEGIPSRAHLIRFPEGLEFISSSCRREMSRKFLHQFPDLP